ncbi:NAD(P)/FAD-dependent oxidoreductase [Sandaracinus amylolyticus]|uniref:NAD(P)/FAD-dependent oxidoreductase n=1 Tax=Sandaracinus amylolyticus TaxID=927083 RepID=UPI001F2A9DCE|nr:NAD(P)/FAD-dependent oxidoreductase [Sandaracinus amylolyticus]UJR84071.1 Hypothetical protein I5071_61420 [Sandaracinus amylolyticus]
MHFDAIVIGAGVVGLACAERLARDGRSVLMIERHPTFGHETSSRNSQVVHAGLYYAPGSLKARLCVAGRHALVAWCAQHGVALRTIGKLVVAVDEDEIAPLHALRDRALENGVDDVVILDAEEIHRREPDVIARAALWSPSSGIVDAHGVMASLLAAARAHRAFDVAFRHELVRAERIGSGYRLVVRDDAGRESEVHATRVVNAAGLEADTIAARIGIDIDDARYRQRWVKGSYCALRRGALRVRSLVYPMPPASLVGLGVHLTLELDGALRLGPDVEPITTRVADHGVRDELAPRFHAAASRFLRGIARDDVTPDRAGIRPKLIAHEGEVRDFVIAEESSRGLPGWVDLIGIESPGLTASLAIADEVARFV